MIPGSRLIQVACVGDMLCLDASLGIGGNSIVPCLCWVIGPWGRANSPTLVRHGLINWLGKKVVRFRVRDQIQVQNRAGIRG